MSITPTITTNNNNYYDYTYTIHVCVYIYIYIMATAQAVFARATAITTLAAEKGVGEKSSLPQTSAHTTPVQGSPAPLLLFFVVLVICIP